MPYDLTFMKPGVEPGTVATRLLPALQDDVRQSGFELVAEWTGRLPDVATI